MANWILSFLSDRSTIISLSEFISEVFKTGTGIPQGSPISPILYLFYNADLMEEDEGAGFRVTDLGYIDDVAKVVTGPNAELNCRRIEGIFAARENQWSKKHASKFAPAKFQLIHFKKPGTRARQLNQPEDDTVHLKDHTIRSQETGIYLGVLLDKELKWTAHLRRTEAGASQALNASIDSSVSRSTLPCASYLSSSLRSGLQYLKLPSVALECCLVSAIWSYT